MKSRVVIFSICCCMFIAVSCGSQVTPQPVATCPPQVVETCPPLPTPTATLTVTPSPASYWEGEWTCFSEGQPDQPETGTYYRHGNLLYVPDIPKPDGIYQLAGTISEDGLSVTGVVIRGPETLTSFKLQKLTEDQFIGYWDGGYSRGDWCCARPGVELPEPCGLED